MNQEYFLQALSTTIHSNNMLFMSDKRPPTYPTKLTPLNIKTIYYFFTTPLKVFVTSKSIVTTDIFHENPLPELSDGTR